MEFLLAPEFGQPLLQNWQLLVVTLLTLAAVVLFVGEFLEIELVALLVTGTLMVTGIVSPQEGLRGFSNPATITIACMFVLSEGLRRTGLVNTFGSLLGDLFANYDFRVAMVGMMVMTGVLSGFINNTAVVAIFLPVVLDASRQTDISSTKVLMALSFSAMFGGVCTLIGTSTNILVSSIVTDHGMAPIGMFEMAPLGIVLFVAGAVYMLTLGERLIPEREGAEELTESFEMGDFLTEIEILPEGESTHRLEIDAMLCGDEVEDLDMLEVVRGDEVFSPTDEHFSVKADDLIRVRGSAEAIRKLIAQDGVVLKPEAVVADTEITSGEAELFEAVVAPNSMLDGSSLNEVDFDETFTANILAIRRRRDLIHQDLMDVPLRGGDVLLLQAPEDRINQLQRHTAFMVLSEVGLSPFRGEKMVPAILTIGGVIATAATSFLSLSVAAALAGVLAAAVTILSTVHGKRFVGSRITILLAALIPLGMAVELPIVVTALSGTLLMTLGGILTPTEAYESVNWQVIMLLAGLIPLGVALENTGGVEIISDLMLQSAAGGSQIVVLAAFYLLTLFLTGIMSNQATAILFGPLAIQTAQQMGVDPRPFVLAVTFAASASFLTPVGYQTNTMIYGAGQYEFKDFVKVGTPLSLLFCVLAVALIPLIWPL